MSPGVAPKFRTETDSQGEMQVPAHALYGASTARALENFTVSGLVCPLEIAHAIAEIKLAAAEANCDLGLLDAKRSQLIVAASRAVADGKCDEHLVIDIFQTGSGTSTNMNVNEVIANVANLAAGSGLGSKTPVHPNDHVNLGQSSNDVFPSAIHIALSVAIEKQLRPALGALLLTLDGKAKEFKDILKVGRTHLQDAAPMFLGQEFSGYKAQVQKSLERLESVRKNLFELAIGGTAVGTGLNSGAMFGLYVSRSLRKIYATDFTEATNHFEAQSARDACVELSGVLKTVAVSMIKIGGDLRLLASGPRCGLGELSLPTVQPGSSIMPGKVNPVMIESLLQVCAQVIGFDATVTWAAAMGQLELNAMMPVIGFDLLRGIQWLAQATAAFDKRCVAGITANREKISGDFEKNMMIVTALVPTLGYDRAAEIAQMAHTEAKPIREILRINLKMSDKQLSEILNPITLCAPTARTEKK